VGEAYFKAENRVSSGERFSAIAIVLCKFREMSCFYAYIQTFGFFLVQWCRNRVTMRFYLISEKIFVYFLSIRFYVFTEASPFYITN